MLDWLLPVFGISKTVVVFGEPRSCRDVVSTREAVEGLILCRGAVSVLLLLQKSKLVFVS